MNTRISHTLLAAIALGLACGPVLAQDKTHTATHTDAATTTKQTADIERPDAWVLAKLKGKFATSEMVDATDINIDVRNGAASLQGTVDSQREHDEAIRLARETEGVTRVDASGLRLVKDKK